MNELTIRPMEIGDVDQVIEVDKASFSTSWTPDIFYQEISENEYAHYYIVETEEEVIGYAGAWIVYEDAQITNIAIKPAYRGKKIGKRLFRFMLQLVRRAGAESFSLEVRASNVVAHEMYRSFCLVPAGVRKN